ncbi:MAG: sulfotransferase [Caulobacteraceae bacterium]
MSDAAAPPAGDLQTSLTHTARLLQANPALAQTQAEEILKVVPGQRDARLLLAAALRRQGAAPPAEAVLRELAREQRDWPPAHVQYGLLLGELGRPREAMAALRHAVSLDAALPDAWRALGDQLSLLGETAAAEDAYARHIKASVNDPRLMEAATALVDNRLAVAERLLRAHLKQHPTDVPAIRMLAETGARLGRYEDAENLLSRALELAPGFTIARHNYASVLYRRNKAVECLEQLDVLLDREPRNPGFLFLKAAALGRIAEFPQSIAIYEDVLKAYPDQAKAWMSYGHALKAVGRLDDGIAAYREAIRRMPELGEAYWSLANLKTFRFTRDEIAAMRGQLERGDISDEDRLHLHYALGKALEDGEAYEESFRHYDQGATIRRGQVDYEPDETSDHVRRSKALFTAAFFAERAGSGDPSSDPIFVVGLPRSGSTLLEQILASHSQVEGTMELPDIIALAKRIGGYKTRRVDADYPEGLADLDREALAALGAEYLESTRIQRKTAKPFFIDKMPNNFQHLGLIHLILPNARIIDARRHPLGCCFSNFKQHFARGQTFSYGLDDIGRYYADYVDLMAHFDAVLPGRIHRVIYERMVADPESEVRALLDYCGLPFEEGCLRFYENDRAVRTASSEQVRQPIYASATDHWRNFEPWLAPLKTALGPVLDAYPEAPAF